MTTFKGPKRYLPMLAILALTLPLAAQDTLIVQTNSAGDNVHIIDAATNEIVAEVSGIERAHGAVASPDGRWIYVSNEADTTVDIIDTQSWTVTKKIPLSDHPNNITVTPDGSKVYVAIARAPGALDVIDTASQENVRTISVHGGVHNVYVTPDGKHAIAGMIGARNITVVDTETDRPLWTQYFDLGIRPMAFEANPDGSTSRIFTQLSNFNGFGVLDFETRKEGPRIAYPELPPEERTPGHGGNTAHGMGVTPNNRYLVANSSLNGSVYIYSLPDLRLMGGVKVGHSPNWVTITPDSRFAYISNAGSNSVSVIDIQAVKVVTEIKTGGQVPKRNATMVLSQ